MGTLARFLAAGITVSAGAARAQVNAGEPDPAVWLRQVYDAYIRAEKTSTGGASTDLVVKRASKRFAAMFKRDSDCGIKEQGVCALDWDFVVDGQDEKLSNVKIGAAIITGDKATVMASFTNFDTPCVNTYDFVRENGQWKVDDVETKSGKEAPIRIAKMFRDYKYK